MATIQYANVPITHASHTILTDVTLSVEPGEMVYLVGQVGSGKTSILKSLYGELGLKQGTALVLGRDMTSIKRSQLPSLRRELGIVHQDLKLLSDRTISHNLDFVLRATGWSDRAQREQRIREVLEWVELQDKAGKYPYELSGGQQQCICIARAVLNQPKIILADEPTGHLDNENGEKIMALLDEVRRQSKCSVIVSTHNLQWPEFFPGTVYQCSEGTFSKI